MWKTSDLFSFFKQYGAWKDKNKTVKTLHSEINVTEQTNNKGIIELNVDVKPKSNSVNIVELYRKAGNWVFDYEPGDLVAEPFVGPANQFLEMLYRDSIMSESSVTLNSDSRAKLIFSEHKMPECNTHLCQDAVIGFSHSDGPFMETGTHWKVLANSTHSKLNGMLIWLCPALFAFYDLDSFPKTIYAQLTRIQ